MSPASAIQPAATLVQVLISGAAADADLVLQTGEVATIGRGPGSAIVLRNRFISAAHAQIANVDGRLVLRDLRSTNGTRIRRGGQVINVDHRCDHEAALEDGDEILLGDGTQPVALRVSITQPTLPDTSARARIVNAVGPSDTRELARTLDRDALLALQDLDIAVRAQDDPGLVARALATWVLRHLTTASHVTISLRDAATGAFVPLLTRGPGGDQALEPVSAAVLTEILATGRTVAFAGDASTSLHDASIREGLSAPLTAGDSVIGIVQADRRTDGPDTSFRPSEIHLLAAAAANVSPLMELSRLRAALRFTVEDAIGALVGIIESRDTYLAGHARAVAELAGRIATRLRLPPEDVDRVRRAGALHDIGRIGVPAEVLEAPGALTPDQFARFRMVPVVGAAIVERFGFSHDIVPIIRHVHERWDGTGYPDGLASHDIPIEARIVAVADAFHTLVSHRMHQAALSQPAALQELAKAVGTRFDARIVGALEVTILSSDETWEFGVATNVGMVHELVAKLRK